jgi:hypothetical protein
MKLDFFIVEISKQIINGVVNWPQGGQSGVVLKLAYI